jgi:uncharacterized protein YjeT (DUF2065 family)
MIQDLLSALCLVAVLEGLVLFAMPRGWKLAVEQLLRLSDRRVRLVGSAFVILGLLSLLLVRGA